MDFNLTHSLQDTENYQCQLLIMDWKLAGFRIFFFLLHFSFFTRCAFNYVSFGISHPQGNESMIENALNIVFEDGFLSWRNEWKSILAAKYFWILDFIEWNALFFLCCFRLIHSFLFCIWMDSPALCRRCCFVLCTVCYLFVPIASMMTARKGG
jgi:hypothetical protein